MDSAEQRNALLDALGSWEGSLVAVRVVASGEDELVAILTGRLGARSDEKHPALFWPLEVSDPPVAERPGIYLHPGSFKGARVHEGNYVVEFDQAGVTVNVRRLDEVDV